MDSDQKRKIATGIVILLVAPILFLFICVLVLFLAPGVRIFGIRYVANNTSVCEKDEQLADPNGGKINGDIHIKTADVPITINYMPYQTFTVKFHQVFVGLTKSKERVADLDIDFDENGNLYLTTTELTTWVYSNSSKSNYFFELTVPTNYQGKSLYIEAHNSKVTINGAGNYQTLSVKTSGELNVENSVTATNFVYHTSKAINLSQDKISCTNADLNSTSNPINVKYALSGDLKAQTNSGDIKFVSCRNLEAKTSTGSVEPYGEGYPSVKAKVTFNSIGGSLTLGNVGEDDHSAIVEVNTSAGSVNITTMYDGKITAERGRVNIGSLRTAIINTRLGDVSIGSVESQLILHGRNGNVDLGSQGTVNNIMVDTTTGKINARNTAGVVYLQSENNNIDIDNDSSQDLTLLAGGKLTAKGLQGKVTAEANGTVNMSFVNVTGDVSLITHNKCKKVTIDAKCVAYNTINYVLTSSRGKSQTVYAGDEVLESKSKIENYREGFVGFNISGSYAEVTLYLAK